ncbi:MAG: ankyrin repeat domain-containing protein [Alphaproteobacteria bacterium]|nr:ankyrin repeat domain-containing protein [Alphaproteobacteria bacterium]
MKKTLLLAFVSMFALQAHASTQELIDSVKNNNISRVLELLNNQENPNGANEQGNTALHYAVALDNADMTQVLLSYGADLNYTNAKGWTPLKIAEKKDLKKVTPVLVQYLQLQKQANVNVQTAPVIEAVKEVVVQQAPEQVKEEIIQVENKTINNIQAQADNIANQVKTSTAVVAEEVAVKKTPNSMQEHTPNAEKQVEIPTITESQYTDMMKQAATIVAEEKNAREQAEQKVVALQNELMKTIAEREELKNTLANKDKLETKTVIKKEEKKAEEKKADAKPVVKEKAEKVVNKKPTPQLVKPVLKKKPSYHAPQPIVKKVVLTPSSMVDGIYTGDEEIVYCLDYLGNGENDNMKMAAGYFAASASISEARYKQIVDKANEFFIKANAEDMTKRDNECSKVITPKDTAKQNQIVRSINKSVGY